MSENEQSELSSPGRLKNGHGGKWIMGCLKSGHGEKCKIKKGIL